MKSLERELQRNLALNLVLAMLLIWLTGMLLPRQTFAPSPLPCQSETNTADCPATQLAPQRRFNWLFPLLAAGGIGGVLFMQGLVIRRTFRQLDSIRAEVSQLASGAINKLNEEVPAEIHPIVQELNHVLALMQERMERSRHALGNLAHALKAPTSLLMQALEAAPAHPQQQQARLQVERIRQLMERELKRARMAGLGNAAQRFVPATELPVLADVLARIHNKPASCIRFTLDPALHSFADREDMLELLGNLLDNACKWSESQVECRLSPAAQGGVLISIEDDGPGGSEQELAQMTARGIRLDESVAGHGLGLAICKDIIRLYGGSLSFGRSRQLGGLQVEVFLPG
ncbi:MAG: sensor histidine kinase [Thiolinea sp.]